MKKEKNTIEYVQPRLKKRIRIYMSLALIMFAIVLWEYIMGNINPLIAFGGFIVGLLIGSIITRIYHISWDDETSEVIGQMDWIGAAILVFYIIFMITRSIYLGQWFQGAPLIALILSITSGTMLGRVLGTTHDIKKILRTLNII